MTDLSAYLLRIGLPEVPPPTVAGMKALQRAQRLAIPFENLDIHLGRGIALDRDAIFDKLVTRRRGGYCFEQNRLLGWALAAIGIATTPMLARVWLNAGNDVPPKTHMLLHTALEGADWIVDAGFGGGYFPPLRLLDGESATGPDGVTHRLASHSAHGWMLDRRGRDDFVPQYSFMLAPAVAADIVMANHWTATAPSSRFVNHVIASRVTADGMISLVDRNFTRSGSDTKTYEVGADVELAHILTTYFDITLPESDVIHLGLFD